MMLNFKKIKLIMVFAPSIIVHVIGAKTYDRFWLEKFISHCH